MQGLQIFDANGNLKLDVTDSLTRVIGDFETGLTNGSISDLELLNGTPWYIVSMNQGSNLRDVCMQSLNITINGSILSWVFFADSSTRNSYHVIYGVF